MTTGTHGQNIVSCNNIQSTRKLFFISSWSMIFYEITLTVYGWIKEETAATIFTFFFFWRLHKILLIGNFKTTPLLPWHVSGLFFGLRKTQVNQPNWVLVLSFKSSLFQRDGELGSIFPTIIHNVILWHQLPTGNIKENYVYLLWKYPTLVFWHLPPRDYHSHWWDSYCPALLRIWELKDIYWNQLLWKKNLTMKEFQHNLD